LVYFYAILFKERVSILELQRQQPIVEAYHFDMRDPKKEAETNLNVGFAPLKPSSEDYPKENSILAARLQFQIVFKQFIISGAIMQVNHIVGKKVVDKKDLSKEETDKLVAPLFDILERLTYEVTEIITDKPGVQLNFNPPEKEQ